MGEKEKVYHDIHRELYNEATPGLDWDDLNENPEEYSDEYFSEHELSKEKQEEIIDKHIEKSSLSGREAHNLRISCILNQSPAYPIDDE